nr:hypothetical protein [uncultured Rhodopila sp.]
MQSRRNLMIAASALSTMGVAVGALADDAKVVDYLLVQTAKGLSFDKATNILSLTGISPVTLFFADRAQRVAGNMKTSAFVPFWSQGTDSFANDPPNADVSIIEGDVMRQVVVELQNPNLDGDVLRYRIKVLQGQMPEKGTDISLFIDIIGMPWTPVSYAGVARRSYRRAWYR